MKDIFNGLFSDSSIRGVEFYELDDGQYSIGLDVVTAISGVELILTESELRKALKFIDDNK